MESGKHGNVRVVWRNPIFWVALFTIVLLAAMFYSKQAGKSMAQRYAPQLGAAVQVRLEATTAHLWFEEIISGDRYIEIEQIWDHLSEADWYAQALLKGGSNSTTTIYPLKSPLLREDARELAEAVQRSLAVTNTRWQTKAKSGIGSPEDQAFDASFMELYRASEQIEADIRKNLQLQLQRFNLIHWSLALFAIGLAIVLAIVFIRHERRRDLDISTLQLRDHQLQASEKRYQALFDKSDEAIFIVDSNTGRFLDSNAAGSKLTGRSHEELLALTTQDVTRHAEERLEKARGACGTVGFEVVECILPDKSIRKARLNAIQLGEDKLIGIAHDITDELLAEERLRRAQKMEAVGQLTGGIAHDFNNILAIILGNVDLLERQPGDQKKVKTRINNIRSSAQRAADLTRQLLGFARKHALEAGGTEINKVLGKMDRLISRSVTPRVSVNYDLSEKLWLASIDSEDFKDSLLNLVLNARDAMPNGGDIAITTSNKIIDQEFVQSHPDSVVGSYVCVTISDSGCGIDKDTLQRIFEPFFTTKPQGKGTGLGLSMVYGFVERSKGFICIDSQPGAGTSIHLYLPRAIDEAQQPDSHETAQISLSTGDELILVVDDEAGLREVALEILQGLGYRVITAGSGEEALTRLEKEQGVSLLFSDIIMPGELDGYQLEAQVRQRFPEIRILLVSGFSGHDPASKKAQFVDASILQKPYSREELASRVREVLDGGAQGVRQNTQTNTEQSEHEEEY